MTTLTDRTPLATLAQILHAAAAVGPDAWGGSEKSPLQNTAGEKTLSDDLANFFALLRDRKISYLLIGGVALLRYIEGRNTDDIDLIIAVDSLEKIPELAVHDRNSEGARARFKNVRVDLLFTANPVFQLAHERYATVHRFAEIDVRTATIEGLILLKLYALPSLYRQGHLQRAALYETDVAMLCLKHQPPIELLLSLLKSHVDQGQFAELERIVAEIQQRVQRMRREA